MSTTGEEKKYECPAIGEEEIRLLGLIDYLYELGFEHTADAIYETFGSGETRARLRLNRKRYN